MYTYYVEIYISKTRFLLHISATGLHLLHSVAMSDWCWAVTHHHNNLYVGVRGGIDIVEEGRKSRFLTTVDQYVVSLQIHSQRIYALVCGTGGRVWSVLVYREEDKMPLTSWKHEDTNMYSNKLVISNNHIYIPSRSLKTLVCYSLTGEPTGEGFPIEELTEDSQTAICTAGGLLFVSCHSPSLVTCIDIEREARLWSVTDLKSPRGMAPDVSGCLLVATGGCTTTVCVEVLRHDTGEISLLYNIVLQLLLTLSLLFVALCGN